MDIPAPRSLRFAGLSRLRTPGWLVVTLLCLVPASLARAEAVVFAAASTRAALETAVDASGMDTVVSYGASGAIARQIAQGAPADAFISANPEWMAYLVDQGLVAPSSVQTLASNRLVLIAPEGTGPVALDPADLAARLSDAFFAVADPAVAPVGQYGREALSSLGLWDTVTPSLLPTANTLATVTTVARGEAALGLVYRSDASRVAGIEIVAEIANDAHTPIRYLIAPIAQGSAPDAAAALIAYLTGPEGQARFVAAGFAPAAGDGP